MSDPQQAQRLQAQAFEPATSYQQVIDAQVAMATRTAPAAFKVRTQMLSAGKSETVLAASPQLTLRLKVYASGGENELHAHRHEDHLFIILQGRAEFSDAQGVLGTFGANEGVVLPKGSVYRFLVSGSEPLVMLRVGSPNEAALGIEGRVDTLGGAFDPMSAANRSVPARVIEGAWYG